MDTSSWLLLGRERMGGHRLLYSMVTHEWMDGLHTSPGKQLEYVAVRVGRVLGVQHDSSLY